MDKYLLMSTGYKFTARYKKTMSERKSVSTVLKMSRQGENVYIKN